MTNLEPAKLPEKKPAGQKWWKLLLVVSVSLNLLVVGVVTGALWRHDRTDSAGPDRISAVLPMIMALDPAQRRVLRADMEEARSQVRNERGSGAARIVDFLDAVRTVPFNAALAEAPLMSHQHRMSSQFDVGRVRLIELISEMTDADRAEYADRVEERYNRRKGRWRRN